MATTSIARNAREREIEEMAAKNAASRSRKSGFSEGVKEATEAGKKALSKAKRNAKAAASEDRMVTGLSALGGAVAGAAAQIKLVNPNIQNVYVKRGLIPGIGVIGGLAALATLDGTPAAAIGGGLIGTAIGSGVTQLAEWLAA